MNKKPFCSLISPMSEGDSADLYIYGDIEEGTCFWDAMTTPVSVLTAIQDCGGDAMTVHINSYGGYTSAGIAIYNTLKACGKRITTICEGFACSSASLIFMAGSQRVMRRSGLLMIHNAWTMADGNADQLRKTADDLDIISAATAKIYEDNCSLSAEEIKRLMDAETWIDAETAMEYGMSTEITGDAEEAAESDTGTMSSYSSAMKSIREKIMMPEAELVQDAITVDGEAWTELLGTLTSNVTSVLQGVGIPLRTEAETQVHSEGDPEEPDEQPGILERMDETIQSIAATVNEILDAVKPEEPEEPAEPEQRAETAFSRLFGNFK